MIMKTRRGTYNLILNPSNPSSSKIAFASGNTGVPVVFVSYALCSHLLVYGIPDAQALMAELKVTKLGWRCLHFAMSSRAKALCQEQPFSQALMQLEKEMT